MICTIGILINLIITVMAITISVNRGIASRNKKGIFFSIILSFVPFLVLLILIYSLLDE